MSESAAKVLESAAQKYASEAIRFDSQGARGMAIKNYQNAIQTLVQLAQLYPDYKLNPMYLQRAQLYQERVKALQSAHGIEPPSDEPDFGLGKFTFSKPAAPASPAPVSTTSSANAKSPQVVQQLKANYNDLIMKEKPSIKWDEVVGLEDAKKALRESIIFPVQRPDLFPLGWPRGLLMYGPPGCGKTLLAAATASEIDSYFITVDAASIMSKWLGEGERNVAKLFNSARKLLDEDAKSVIVFIDELDSILGSRTNEVGGEVRVRNQFLKEMDGIADKGRNLHLYIIGATNKPWSLDWPFLRRFQKRIYVPLPDIRARMQMLRQYTAPLKMDIELRLDDLSKMTEGYSGSDMRDICQSVQLRVVSELFDSAGANDKDTQPRAIDLNDFKEVLRNRRPSVSQEMLRGYVNWAENFKAL
ncbi:MAG: AAA family ATPase [archaeon]|jgi:SpoVK/Ycf46/Vps4 family AAA+-type ATPase|nr:AAA family ATPase [archaeon]